MKTGSNMWMSWRAWAHTRSRVGNTAIIEGVERYTGAQVSSPDLRAGAALVIAGLAADGITIVDDIHYIERGYERFDEKLRSLGAEIEKVSDERAIQKFRLRVG